jgi:hypothetical protein
MREDGAVKAAVTMTAGREDGASEVQHLLVGRVARPALSDRTARVIETGELKHDKRQLEAIFSSSGSQKENTGFRYEVRYYLPSYCF